jgi:predicted DNA-binding transcriptional regulator AlpA
MDNSTHQETLTKAIQLLDADIERQRELLNALVDAREVLKIYSTEMAFPGYNEYNFLTRAQVTKYLGVAHTSIHRYIAGKVPRGKPPFPQPTAKVGHKQLYKREEIVAWKNALNFTSTDA